MFLKKNCQTSENLWQQDYRIYRLSKAEKLKYGSIGFLLGSVILYFFYRTIFVLFFGIPCSVLYCQWKGKELGKKRRHLLEQQFKDWISAAVSGVQAGYAVENALIRAGGELESFYGEETDIRKEIHNMEHLLANNVTLEKILQDFGERSGIDDIRNFANVFSIGKRSGGNLQEMIENFCEIVVMKMNVEREIRILLYGKKMEQRIMCIIPFGIILYVGFCSPGYFLPLYESAAGIIIMTICLFFYALSVGMSFRIVRIEV